MIINFSNFEWSGKFLLCQRLLTSMREFTNDRMVIVSNYTQTLDIFSKMCDEFNWPFVRLDGQSSAKRRQAMVDRLNNPLDDVFVFLLSSKAGGCGLNLIGANRLILFDPDWNPATDKQAAARVWRDGQKKRTYVYRFLATGTIEEKVYQRQLSKEGLQSVVEENQDMESAVSSSDLKDLFTLQENTASDTHDKFMCKSCKPRTSEDYLPPIKEMDFNELNSCANNNNDGKSSSSLSENVISDFKKSKLQRGRLGSKIVKKFVTKEKNFVNVPTTTQPDNNQLNLPNDGDLNEWSHHYGCDSCDDVLLRIAGKGLVSFVFGQAIDGESLAKKAQADSIKEKTKKAEKEQKNDYSSEKRQKEENDVKSVDNVETKTNNDYSPISVIKNESDCGNKKEYNKEDKNSLTINEVDDDNDHDHDHDHDNIVHIDKTKSSSPSNNIVNNKDVENEGHCHINQNHFSNKVNLI